jgi:argininosuccinate lyase
LEDDRASIFAREGQEFPGATYKEVVLEPAYENAKRELLPAMLAANKAHLVMLVEQNLVAQKDAEMIMRAIAELDEAELQTSPYTGEFEDLFFHVEHLILESAGEPAGNLHLARSRNDLGVAMYRMVLRDRLLRAEGSLLDLQGVLLAVASEHLQTVMPAYTHTQQAQPTTLAHYLLAVHDSLSRDLRRLRAAFENCNRSPLGAAALTTSGFAMDRGLVAELLAFDGLVENSYDAIGGVDYLGETATALQLSFLGLGRFANDLLLWSTQEFGAIRVADPYVQVSSIMPQKRNPVSLEHVRSLLSAAVGDANTVLTMLHNTPFGDVVDTEDDLQPYLWRALEAAAGLYRLLAAVVGTMDVNRELLLERAGAGYSTVTELADALLRERGLSFRTAHAVVTAVVKLAESEGVGAGGISPGLVDRAAEGVIGEPLDLSADQVSHALDPVRFVEIRSLPGGPAPEETRRALEERRTTHTRVISVHRERAEQISKRLQELDSTATSWGKRA